MSSKFSEIFTIHLLPILNVQAILKRLNSIETKHLAHSEIWNTARDCSIFFFFGIFIFAIPILVFFLLFFQFYLFGIFEITFPCVKSDIKCCYLQVYLQFIFLFFFVLFPFLVLLPFLL